MNVYYQPIVELETGAVVRVEAFCRLGDGKLGEIAAAEFLPHAERNGLMRELTEGVIVQVLTDRASWATGLPVAINLSQANLFESDFPERVTSLLARFDVDPSHVTFEINDGIQDLLSPEERQAMNQLAVTGVRFSLDGFDLGRAQFTPLSVTRLPISEIKIDAKLLSLGAPPDRAVRRSMAFAREAQLDVVVKSVENTREIDALRAVGCALAQGFAFGAPMDSATFAGRMETYVSV